MHHSGVVDEAPCWFARSSTDKTLSSVNRTQIIANLEGDQDCVNGMIERLKQIVLIQFSRSIYIMKGK